MDIVNTGSYNHEYSELDLPYDPLRDNFNALFKGLDLGIAILFSYISSYVLQKD